MSIDIAIGINNNRWTAKIKRLSLLMIAIVRIYEKIGQENVATVIRKNYLINEDGKDDERYKVLLTNQDKETYIALVDGIENELKDPSQPFLDAFNLFMSLLECDEENNYGINSGSG